MKDALDQVTGLHAPGAAQPGLPPEGLYHRIIQQVEVPLINATLAVTGGNQIKAANLLGINRNTLRSRIKELGLSVVRTPGSRG